MLFRNENKCGLGYVETEEESNNKKGRIITRDFRKYRKSFVYGEEVEIGSGGEQYNVGRHEGSRGGIETTSVKSTPPNTQNTLSQFTQLPQRNPSVCPQSQPRPPQHASMPTRLIPATK